MLGAQGAVVVGISGDGGAASRVEPGAETEGSSSRPSRSQLLLTEM